MPFSFRMAVPSTQIGVLRDEISSKLETFSVPSPGPGEVLIQNVAAASNPKDWKYPLWGNDFSYIEGSDVAGEIVKLGEGVSDLKVGQRVAAFTKTATKQNKVSAFFSGYLLLDFAKNNVMNLNL